MAQVKKEIDELELVTFYENNAISVRALSAKFGINSQRCAGILRNHNSEKFKRQSKLYGSEIPWNKGKTKNDNEILRQSVKKQSFARRTHYTKDGYQKVFCDKLNRAVKVHDYVWFENTGCWPNSKIGEQVHHIDGNHHNNSFDNLLLTSVSEHSAIHKEYEEVFLRLCRLGLVKFDKESRRIDWITFQTLIEKLSV